MTGIWRPNKEEPRGFKSLSATNCVIVIVGQCDYRSPIVYSSPWRCRMVYKNIGQPVIYHNCLLNTKWLKYRGNNYFGYTVKYIITLPENANHTHPCRFVLVLLQATIHQPTCCKHLTVESSKTPHLLPHTHILWTSDATTLQHFQNASIELSIEARFTVLMLAFQQQIFSHLQGKTPANIPHPGVATSAMWKQTMQQQFSASLLLIVDISSRAGATWQLWIDGHAVRCYII